MTKSSSKNSKTGKTRKSFEGRIATIVTNNNTHDESLMSSNTPSPDRKMHTDNS